MLRNAIFYKTGATTNNADINQLLVRKTDSKHENWHTDNGDRSMHVYFRAGDVLLS